MTIPAPPAAVTATLDGAARVGDATATEEDKTRRPHWPSQRREAPIHWVFPGRWSHGRVHYSDQCGRAGAGTNSDMVSGCTATADAC